ncbi:hypothetical protein EPA93_43320 [Ktedonosporobacter rubrisoli]|uniref:Uncharacterized protein n=1 Tax=Ktedonosporobacter rubrisoli TaxID=2509675 RepID=A0A4P6K2K3_KTERU|nr:hypothetical protein [Ktedonosporobacter rubrisoli]QBD82447.1 hypothetical protein EPA93_43320 [Ktedonosporobacter rubrisoli]
MIPEDHKPNEQEKAFLKFSPQIHNYILDLLDGWPEECEISTWLAEDVALTQFGGLPEDMGKFKEAIREVISYHQYRDPSDVTSTTDQDIGGPFTPFLEDFETQSPAVIEQLNRTLEWLKRSEITPEHGDDFIRQDLLLGPEPTKVVDITEFRKSSDTFDLFDR